MPTHQEFREILKFSELPADWQVTWVATDWNGAPLLLAVEGKPRFPTEDARAIGEWYSIPAKAHHLVYWDGSTRLTLTLEDSGGLLSPKAIQPIGAGWLVDNRGHFRVYDQNGRVQRTLELGGGINDVQTTPNGQFG